MSLACILIAGADYKRATLLDEVILPKALAQPFDEVLVVGDHHEGTGYRYLHVPALSRTTNDALVKRDAGTLATKCDNLFYVSDDHYPLVHGNVEDADPWDVLVPMRWTARRGTRIPLNNGEQQNYCGGHGGVFRRWVVEACPWSAGPHHRNWDLLISRHQQVLGATFKYHNPVVEVVDVEPNAKPWL